MRSLLYDLRQALRALVKAPAFTLVTILTLALGIGANTAIFSLVNAVLLRPLGYPDAHRLMLIHEGIPQSGVSRFEVSPADYLDLVALQRSFSAIGAYRTRTLELSGRGEPEQVHGAEVTASVFDVLGVAASQGRTFLARRRPARVRRRDHQPRSVDAAIQRRCGPRAGAAARSAALHDRRRHASGVRVSARRRLRQCAACGRVAAARVQSVRAAGARHDVQPLGRRAASRRGLARAGRGRHVRPGPADSGQLSGGAAERVHLGHCCRAACRRAHRAGSAAAALPAGGGGTRAAGRVRQRRQPDPQPIGRAAA